MKTALGIIASALGAIFLLVLLIFAAVGVASVCFSGSSSAPARVQPAASATASRNEGGGADFPLASPTQRATATATLTPLPTSPPPTATRPPTIAPTTPPAQSVAPDPTTVPVPSPALPAQSPPSPATANFTGNWRIVDTVLEGSNTGQTYSFDVRLNQSGNSVSGGNSGISITGYVEGSTAYLTYVQPALGYTGTFTWSMVSSDRAQGTFTNSYPNAGSSILIRLS